MSSFNRDYSFNKKEHLLKISSFHFCINFYKMLYYLFYIHHCY
ncbi:hypothetical protein FM106_02910 [Brachybacterium faecium]|nr:hypothetical protein FM106_02910 [Brachybacterium faecium]